MKTLFNILAIGTVLWIVTGRVVVPTAMQYYDVQEEQADELDEDESESQIETERDQSVIQEMQSKNGPSKLSELEARVKTLEAAKPQSCEIPQELYQRLDAIERQIKDDPEVIKRLEDTLKQLKELNKQSDWHPVDRAIVRARAQHKILLIFVRQTKCTPCDEFEANVLANKQVSAKMKSTYLVEHINTDKQPDQEVAARFKVVETPAMIVYTPGDDPTKARYRVYDRSTREGTAWLPESPVSFIGLLGV